MKIKNEMNRLFLREKPANMLIAIKNNKDPVYATQVSKAVDCTYSHTVKILDAFKKLNLVEFEKMGRVKVIRLTEDGLEIAHDLEGLTRKFVRILQKPKKASK